LENSGRVHEEGGVLFFRMLSFCTYGFYYPTCSKTGSQVIAADATSVADLENLVDQAMKSLAVK
jgi:enoyl-[acyl-carrier protein] reductase I